MKCTQCNSDKIIENVRAIDRTNGIKPDDFSLEIYNDPKAMFFKEPQALKLKPLVCSECGFVMFSLSNSSLSKIKKHIAKHKKS
jgi:predicted Zn-ribbon and HTH transcriptional regulator